MNGRSAQERRLNWMWVQNQRREHERKKQQFIAQFERDRAEKLRQEGEKNRDSRSDDNRESRRDEPSRSHHRERNKSPMVNEKRLTFTVEAKEADPNTPTLNYQNVVIARRPGSIAGEGSRQIFDRPEIRVNRGSSSSFATYRQTSSERASSYAPVEEFRTIAVVNPAQSSTASAPRRTDHRRSSASSPGREPARFEPSSSSSICRRFQEISLGNHRSRARSRSRGPRPNERDDHRRVHRRSRSSSASRHRREDASESRRRSHHSRSLSRSSPWTSQHYRSERRRRSRSPERSRRYSSRSRSRSPPRRGSREHNTRGHPDGSASVYGPQMPYPFIMQPPGMFPMGPFPGGAINPLPRFAFPPPPPPPPHPRHPASRFNAGPPPYYRAPYR